MRTGGTRSVGVQVRCEVRPTGITLDVKKGAKVTPSSKCNCFVTLTKAAMAGGEIEMAINKPISAHFQFEGETLQKIHSSSLRNQTQMLSHVMDTQRADKPINSGSVCENCF